jgi:hypothetical protein
LVTGVEGPGHRSAAEPAPDHEGRIGAVQRHRRFDKNLFLRTVPGDWVAVKLGYTGLCILDDHTKHPNSNYLHRYGDPKIVWYRCWPCGVKNLHAWDLLKETIARSDFAGDLEAETLHHAETLYGEWRGEDAWEPDEALFKDRSGSWTDLRAGDPGSSPSATTEDLQRRLDEARDPDRFARVFERYCRERKERSFPPAFDSFGEVDPSFVTESFGWAATEFDSFLVPFRSPDGELMTIQRVTARKKTFERGRHVPVLYGLERRGGETSIVIAEGIADTVRLAWEYRDEADLVVIGLTSAAFSEGAVPTETFEGTAVTILGDGDDAGRRATEKLADTLSKAASVSVVPLPEGYKDVCSYEGDLKALIDSAVPRTPEHYLERPEVSRTLDKIVKGTAETKLRAILDELPPLSTDKLDQTLIRKAVADRLTRADFPVAIADAWVATHPREDKVFDQVAGAVQGRDVQPWPDPVDGAELLQDISALYRRFVFIQNPRGYDVEAAFTVLTYCFRQFLSLPYIHLPSPMPESGKTRNLELLEFCCNRAYIFIDPSASVIFRFVEEFGPTLLLDEVDNIFSGRDEDSKQLKSILNSGYTAGKYVPRTATRPDGSRYTELFSPYGPKVLAGIRSIPQTLRSRCIVIPMMRKLAGEEVEEFHEPVRLEVEKVASVIRSKIVRWIDDQLAGGTFDRRPEFPPGLGDRMRDCWRPLFVIANAAGGAWPERIRDAAISLSVKVTVDDDDEIGALLEDLRAYFEAAERTEADLEWSTTSALLLHLTELDHRPWKYMRNDQGMSPTKLASLLKTATNGRALPVPRKVNGKVLRGYAYEPIRDSIDRYLGRRDTE